MGVDFLDIRMRAEREFGVIIEGLEFVRELLKLVELAESNAAESGTRVPCDITVGQMFGVICNRIYHQHGNVPEDAWPRFVAIVVEVLYVEPEEVTPEAWLNRDLGMD
jgi:acyl carrier protein